ncbi:MAG TPA: hypothetical protein VF212_10745 [Longimicrobiales bacterium]
MSYRHVVPFMVALLSFAASTAVAQQPGRRMPRQPAAGTPPSAERAQPMRSRFGASFGLVVSDPTDDRCTDGRALGAGAELRTRGAWLAAAAVDLLMLGSGGCITVGKTVEFEGREAEEFTGESSAITTRLSVRAGRAFRVAGLIVEPAAGIGTVVAPFRFPSESVVRWKPWYGASLTLRGAGSRFGVQFEYGTREVPTRYSVYASGWTAVHEFDRWGNVFRLSLTM